MCRPPPIELGSLFIGKREFSLPLGVGEAFPESQGQFSAVAGWKFQQLGQGTGFHSVILSRESRARQRNRPRSAWSVRNVTAERVACSPIVVSVQRSNVRAHPRPHSDSAAAVGCSAGLDLTQPTLD
jgi:hypothetical protein